MTVPEKIPYLKELGVNAVEKLMPVFEFDELANAREIDGKMLLDYWGYNSVTFLRQIPAIPHRKSLL